MINDPETYEPYLKGLLSRMQEPVVEYKTRFLIKIGETFVTVFTHEISYYMVEHDITYVVLRSGKKYVMDQTLEELTGQLNPQDFFRLNRKCLAHIASIVEVHPFSRQKLKVELKPNPGTEVVVSREKALMFKHWLDW
jgi:DNA-binding LytR/AlgR family response regulator